MSTHNICFYGEIRKVILVITKNSFVILFIDSLIDLFVSYLTAENQGGSLIQLPKGDAEPKKVSTRLSLTIYEG